MNSIVFAMFLGNAILAVFFGISARYEKDYDTIKGYNFFAHFFAILSFIMAFFIF